MDFSKSIIFLLSILFTFSAQAAINGKIDYVVQSSGAADNFKVYIKPGWTGSGCTTGQNNNAQVVLTFAPSNNVQYDSYERNFSMAMAAAASNATVTLHNNANGCAGGYAITIFGND